VTVVEGMSMDPVEFLSPKMFDLESDTISVEISGNNDIIVSEQEGDFVKTTVYTSQVTSKNKGSYTIVMNLVDNASTTSTEVSQIVIIEYEGTSEVIPEEEEVEQIEDTEEELIAETPEIDYT